MEEAADPAPNEATANTETRRHVEPWYVRARVPNPVFGSFAVLVIVAAGLCLTRFHVRDAGMQLAARSDHVELRLATSLRFTGLRVSGFSVRGATRIEFAGKPGRASVDPGESFHVVSRPSTGGTAPVLEEESVGLFVGSGMRVLFAHHSEQVGESYAISAEGTAATPVRLDLLLEDGQALAGRATDLGQDAATGLPITLFADRGTLDVHALVRSKKARIPPIEVAGLNFNEEIAEPTSASGVWSSGLLEAQLTFIDVPDKATTIRQGGILLLGGLRATVHSLELDASGVTMTVTGDVDSAKVTIGHTARELIPNWLEYVLNSENARFFLGSVSLLGAFLRWLEVHLNNRRMRESGNKT